MCFARFKSRQSYIIILYCCAFTRSAPDARKDAFYERFQDVVYKVFKHVIQLIVGDFNAMLGESSDKNFKSVWEKMCVENEMNDNVTIILNFSKFLFDK